jgi:hypothetical protein
VLQVSSESISEDAMIRAIFIVFTVFVGVLFGVGLGSQAWGVGTGGIVGALVGAAAGWGLALAALRVGGFEAPSRS